MSVRHLVIGALLTTLAGLSSAECPLIQQQTFAHEEIGKIKMLQDPASRAIAFASQMHVNTDGAPDSYHPNNIGITHICNGIKVGSDCKWKKECLPDYRQAKVQGFKGSPKICFFAMATDKQGMPIVQGENDPKPGYFVSTTALKQPGRDVRTPQAQLDSNAVPFAVIPRSWNETGKPGPRLGDFGVAWRRSSDKLVYFVVGDTGPKKKLGEGSVALHQALGNDPFQMRYGVRRAWSGIGGRDVVYLMFPGSAQSVQTYDTETINRLADERLQEFGGIKRLKECATRLVK